MYVNPHTFQSAYVSFYIHAIMYIHVILQSSISKHILRTTFYIHVISFNCQSTYYKHGVLHTCHST